MNPEGNPNVEKVPEAPQNTEKEEVEESVKEAPNKDISNKAASLANAFVVGTNLSLSSEKEGSSNLIVEEEDENEASSNLIVEEKDENEASENDNNEKEETNENENEATAPHALASQRSLMDDDSEGVSPDEKDDETLQANSGRGAQILRNRWSSWQKKANETVNQAMKNPRFSKNTANTTDDGSDSISPASSDSTHDSSLNSNSTREQQAAARTVAVRVAASNVVDTVASGFRGRYAIGATAPATPESTKDQKAQNMTPSQTALIMQSRAKAHMQSILDSLEPQEYVMLLGNGMLGVNLKQAYLKNNGVYIDFLVEGGSAEQSGVVGVGDNLMKVGDVNVFRRGLIVNVPQTIAAAKRPVVLVFSTGQDIPLERMNYIDVAVGMMHKIREEKNCHRDISTLPIQASDEVSSVGDNTSVQTDGSIGEKSSRIGGDTDAEEKPIDVFVPQPSFEGPNPMHLTTPPLALREMVSPHVAKRSYDQFSLSMLCQAATTDSNFRAILQNAFVTCVYDGRRLPFLSSHFSYQESYENGESEEDFQMTTASTQLMLFLELTTFAELYSITPEEKRRDIAKRIAFKFFLPSKVGDSLEPPMFDFHHIVPDSDLRALEHALNDATHPVGRNVFVSFQKAVMETLSGPPFLSFLISVECARMRAYLRNTAPFHSVCPGEIFLGVENMDSAMENRLQYLLMYLICQVEREIGDEHDVLSGTNHERVMGAAGGVACAVYIKKRLLNAIEEVNKIVEQAESRNENDVPYYNLVEAMEVAWEAFIAPGGGMLDSVANSAETDAELKRVREILGRAVLPSTDSSEREKVVALASTELIEAFSSLSDQLLYDYAVTTYSKFKEHRFHEWLCNELVIGKADDAFEDTTTQELKTGCISRLIRKAKLPTGISPHKPIRLEQGASNNSLKCPNAEFAIVFGTDDGSGEVNPVPNPAMNRTDIRRYVCQAVTDDTDVSSAPTFRVPQTLESYVTVPLLRRVPFSEYADDSRISADGWEITMVNFMVPNADTKSDNHDEKGLYVVSLVFQRRGETLVALNGTKIELAHQAGASKETTTPQKSTDDGKGDVASFASPISHVSTPKEPGDSKTECSSTRIIQVSMSSPVFNRRLEEDSWSVRMENRRRVVAGPVTVGIALVCRRNVVLAMRESLTRFLHDHCRPREKGTGLICGPLVELLGNFSHPDVEATALKAILEPYLRVVSASWVDRPLHDQKHQFEIEAGQQLLNCLPLIPLALLFVTLLLEQKVVFSSSRRSVLFSAVISVTRLLKPLRWSHLLVPLVPSALARDLLQYPAPFILGIPSEDPGNMEVLNALPSDVTLVDLDVGRVILASHFAHDDELVRNGEDPRITAAALRSQVLYLAQSLGLLFGSKLRKQTWNVDSPSVTSSVQELQTDVPDIEKLQAVCRSFLVELLSGTESCCFWIEERQPDRKEGSQSAPTETECTVLFDEDRFFHIKNLRAKGGRYKPLFEGSSPFQRSHGDYDVDGPMSSEDGLALSLDDFDLILETFLRCQSMSTFVSSRPKGRMAFV